MAMMISAAPILRASFGIEDTLFLFVLALVVFGPKRLPEIGRQIGKIYGEFRRASNEFKFQIEDELRRAEETEQQKKLESQPSPQILPPASGQPVAHERTPAPGAAQTGEAVADNDRLAIGQSIENPSPTGGAGTEHAAMADPGPEDAAVHAGREADA